MSLSTDRPNVVLVVLDTLRPDYLSCYGGEVETPILDNIALKGTLFEHAYAAGPGSSISHAALFTGKYPSESGVVGQVDIPESEPVIAEWLHDRGYDTFGIPGPSRIGSHWGYDRGFDQYVEKWHDIPSGLSIEDLRKGLRDPTLLRPMPGHMYRWATRGPGKHTTYLIDVLSEKIDRDLQRPFYAFANFPTVHGPFDPPRPYKEEATPGLDRPRWEFLEWLGIGEETLEIDDVRAERVFATEHHDGVAEYFADPSWLSEAELQVLRDWYGAAVKFLDDQFRRFLEYYERELADDTYLLVAADHGEHLGEHDLLRHMYSHFDECLHVPLLVRGPDVPEGVRRSDVVSLVDVFDTICDLVGVDLPSTTAGSSLFGDARRDAAFAENGHRELSADLERILPRERRHEFAQGYKSIRDDEYLYVLGADDTERLYERPDEVPVAEPDPAVLDRYRSAIEDVLGTEFGIGYQEDDYDDAVEQNLRELGYIE